MKRTYLCRDGSVIELSDEEFRVYPKNIHLRLIKTKAKIDSRDKTINEENTNDKHTRKRRRA